MNSEHTPQAKRPWEAPEIVDIGGIVELTEAMTTNVNDGSRMAPTTYFHGRKAETDEVDLDGR